jgi:hypothetical protein
MNLIVLLIIKIMAHPTAAASKQANEWMANKQKERRVMAETTISSYAIPVINGRA